MRKFKFFITSVAALLAVMANGQDRGKWFLGIGTHASNYLVKEITVGNKKNSGSLTQGLGIKDWNISPALSEITVGHKFMDYLAWDARATINSGLSSINENVAEKQQLLGGISLYLNVGAGIRAFYELDFWEPYARLGVAYHRFNYKNNKKALVLNEAKDDKLEKDIKGGNHSLLVQGGLGMNFWIGEAQKFGINLEGNYNWNPLVKADGGKSFGGIADHIQVSAGVVFRFGGAENGLTSSQMEKINALDDVNSIVGSLNSKVESIGGDVEGLKGDVEVLKTTPVVAVPEVINTQVIDDINLAFKDIQFALGKSEIHPRYKSTLKEAANKIKHLKGVVLYVNGYADKSKKSTTASTFNTALSKRRAQSVKNALVNNGVDSNMLKVKGCGESTYFSTQSENRRVEISQFECDKM